MSALTVVVIIVSVVGGLAVVITPFVWALLRRRDAMRGVADGLGLRFWAGLWKRPGASPVEVPVDLGRRQRVVMAMWGHWHGLDVAVCDVAFDTAGVSGPQGAGISGGKSITVAEAKLHAWLPETWVKPRGALSFRKGLETGSSDFDQAFQVESADAEFARAVLDPPMRQTLLQAPGGMRYWWGESYAMVLPHHRLHPKGREGPAAGPRGLRRKDHTRHRGEVPAPAPVRVRRLDQQQRPEWPVAEMGSDGFVGNSPSASERCTRSASAWPSRSG